MREAKNTAKETQCKTHKKHYHTPLWTTRKNQGPLPRPNAGKKHDIPPPLHGACLAQISLFMAAIFYESSLSGRQTFTYYVILGHLTYVRLSVSRINMSGNVYTCVKAHDTLTQCWINVGPASQTVYQHCTSIGLCLLGCGLSKCVNIALRRFLHNHSNIATEGSPKQGLCPTLISNAFNGSL